VILTPCPDEIAEKTAWQDAGRALLARNDVVVACSTKKNPLSMQKSWIKTP